MPPRPERPADADYYERDRVALFSQGDLFRDVPLAYPLPANELVVDEESGGSRGALAAVPRCGRAPRRELSLVSPATPLSQHHCAVRLNGHWSR